MITAATADTVRELERRTMITVGDDALMQQQRVACGAAALPEHALDPAIALGLQAGDVADAGDAMGRGQ